MNFHIRQARPGDSAVIFELIRELADYERLTHEVEASEAETSAALFADSPRVFCDLAEVDGSVVGFALWYYTFSTFRGRHGIYLEDLFVKPECRGQGIGKGLMRRLAQRCIEERLGRFEWSVLDWNEPSLAFYRSRGARVMDDWLRCRIDGEALQGLAQDSRGEAT